jgi:hypothetical protein
VAWPLLLQPAVGWVTQQTEDEAAPFTRMVSQEPTKRSDTMRREDGCLVCHIHASSAHNDICQLGLCRCECRQHHHRDQHCFAGLPVEHMQGYSSSSCAVQATATH